MGQDSLQHIVGGPENLWARPFFTQGSKFNGERDLRRSHPGNFEGPMAETATEKEGGGSALLSEPLMLLAARLQGAVALGRGPAVARALTATVVSARGGEWVLPRVRPVQVSG